MPVVICPTCKEQHAFRTDKEAGEKYAAWSQAAAEIAEKDAEIERLRARVVKLEGLLLDVLPQVSVKTDLGKQLAPGQHALGERIRTALEAARTADIKEK